MNHRHPAKVSMEGALCEALEAAAQRIQLASRDTSMSGSCGYQSDTDKSSGQESGQSSSTTASSKASILVGGGPEGDTETSSLTDDPTSRLSRSSSNSLPSTASSGSSNGTTSNNSNDNGSENDSFISDDDLDSEISFLEKKQAILERASEALKRDEAYMVLKAHDIVNGKYLLFGSSLWSEARAIIDVLKKEGGGLLSDSPIFYDDREEEEEDEDDDDDEKKRRFPPLGSSIAFIEPPPTKRPKIDLSMVELVSSSDFGCPSSSVSSYCVGVGSVQSRQPPRQNGVGNNDRVITIESSSTMDASLVPEHVAVSTNTIEISSSGHWMAQTMIYQISALTAIPDSTTSNSTSSTVTPAETGTRKNSLDVLLDPTLGPLVVSPSQQPFRNAIQLTTALGLTSSAQLIVMPTPPFSIVHANKAFCNLSGLTHSQVIGRPIEDVLQVVQEIPHHHPKTSDALDTETGGDCCVSSTTSLKGRFVLTPEASDFQQPHDHHSRLCQIHVSPITDRSRNSRGMTHVLAKITPRHDDDDDEEEESTVGVGGTIISTDSIRGGMSASGSSTSHASIAGGAAPTSRAGPSKGFDESNGMVGGGKSTTGPDQHMSGVTHKVTVG